MISSKYVPSFTGLNFLWCHTYKGPHIYSSFIYILSIIFLISMVPFNLIPKNGYTSYLIIYPTLIGVFLSDFIDSLILLGVNSSKLCGLLRYSQASSTGIGNI